MEELRGTVMPTTRKKPFKYGNWTRKNWRKQAKKFRKMQWK